MAGDARGTDPGTGGPTPGRPVVGVGAVILRPGRVLLVRRGAPPLCGDWSLPGGRQELGETVVEAVHREVAEETGVVVRVLGLVEVVDLIERQPSGRIDWHYTVIDLAAAWERGEPRAGSDAAEAAWFSFAALPALGLSEATDRVIASARRLWPAVAG